jgi:NADPH:quinone reductase-like Zn-dependent oxidoreductase
LIKWDCPGGVGGYAVQLAKYQFGADVTGVCSTTKLAFVKSLGADQVIDYTQEDFTQNGQIYDVIFDTVGKTSVLPTKKSLKENGSYPLATFGLPMLLQLLWFSKVGNQNFEFGTLKEKTEDLIFLKELIEAGVIKPTIDRSYPLEWAVDSHRYVESGHKKGK